MADPNAVPGLTSIANTDGAYGEDPQTPPEQDSHTLDAVGGVGVVDSIVAGTNITVDSSDPANPVVSSTAAGGFVVAGEIADFPAAANHMYFVDATAGDVVATLPAPANGIQVIVKKIDATANTVTVDPHGGESIDQGGPVVISTQFESRTFISDTSNWWVI